jgi:hypothetical protein
MLTEYGITKAVFEIDYGNKKDIENPARGIAKITRHSSVQRIAGHDMFFCGRPDNQTSP